VFSKCIDWSLGKIDCFQAQHKRADDHQRTFAATTARNIRLIEGTILTSHTGIACHVEHNAQRTWPHHGFNLLISVECTYIEEYYPKCIVLGNMS